MIASKPTPTHISLWAAVGITVLLAMPFGLWFGKYNFTLWVAFIVWAEYFAPGGKPSAWRIILPSFSVGAILTSGILLLMPAFSLLPSTRTPNDFSSAVVLAGGVAFFVFVMRWSVTLQKGSCVLQPHDNDLGRVFQRQLSEARNYRVGASGGRWVGSTHGNFRRTARRFQRVANLSRVTEVGHRRPSPAVSTSSPI